MRTSAGRMRRARVALAPACRAAGRPGRRRRAPATSGAVPSRMSLGTIDGVHRPGGDAAPIALLPDDAEVAELQPPAIADEHVHRRQVAVQQLAAMQLAQHLEDAGDLAARCRFGPRCRPARRCALRSPWQRVLERQAVEHLAVGAHQREAIEDADRARMAVEQLAEVGLAQPAVLMRADLDADLAGIVLDRPRRSPGRPGRSRRRRASARCGRSAGLGLKISAPASSSRCGGRGLPCVERVVAMFVWGMTAWIRITPAIA